MLETPHVSNLAAELMRRVGLPGESRASSTPLSGASSRSLETPGLLSVVPS